jgi:carboxyl-terminal processing protease
MKAKQLSLTFIILFSLACNTVMQLVETPTVPTATLLPSLPPPATLAPDATLAPEATAPVVEGDVYIPPDCLNQPLATVSPESVDIPSTSTLEPNPVIAQDVQERVFEDLVQVVKDYYIYYPDMNGVNFDELTETYRAKVESGLETEAFYTEMEQFVIDLGDEHSQFEPPVVVEASDQELSGNVDFVGIGAIIIPYVEKERVVILSVFPDSPAEHAGLKQHDSFLAVDGAPIVREGEPESYRTRGPECTALVLTVQSPGEAPRDIMLIRHRITTPQPIVAQLVPTNDGSRIGYIFIPTFYDETIVGQVRSALESFGTLDGLILDNRMNGGGSSSVVDPIFGFFTSGVVGHFVSRDDERELNIQAEPINNSQDVPLVVLVGEDTVSFGEIFSGALQDMGRAKLVGQTTLGNVETLHAHYFEDGSRTWLAEERFDPLISGESANWEEVGIKPDVEAYADWDSFTFENDPGVKAAVEVLGHN